MLEPKTLSSKNKKNTKNPGKNIEKETHALQHLLESTDILLKLSRDKKNKLIFQTIETIDIKILLDQILKQLALELQESTNRMKVSFEFKNKKPFTHDTNTLFIFLYMILENIFESSIV